MSVLVTGGTGFLGRHLARALLAQGHTVAIMGRSFDSAQELVADGAAPIAADLRDREAVARACQGVEAVFHVGALSAAWGRRADFFATNVGGTEAVLEGARRAGVRRIIYVSSPSVLFNGRDQRDLRDDAPFPRRFASVYSLSKKLGEDRVRASGLEHVIIRPKAIFGPGDTSLLPPLLAAARRGRLPQIGHGHNLVDLTYVDNVVHALLLALDAKAAANRTYAITNGEHVPLWGVIRRVLRELGIPARLRPVPLSVMLAAATAMEARATLFGGTPLLTRYTAAILARTQTYDIGAAERDLGYAPVVSVEQGIERTLGALRS